MKYSKLNYQSLIVNFIFNILTKEYQMPKEKIYSFFDISRGTYKKYFLDKKEPLNKKTYFLDIDTFYENSSVSLDQYKRYPKDYIPDYDALLEKIKSLLIDHKDDIVTNIAMKNKILNMDTFGKLVEYMVYDSYNDYLHEESAIIYIDLPYESISHFFHAKLELMKRNSSVFMQIRDLPQRKSKNMYSYAIQCNRPVNYSNNKELYLSIYLGKHLTIDKVKDIKNEGAFISVVFIINPEFNYIDNESLINNAIYIESLKTRRLLEQKMSKMFLYNKSIDADSLIILNKIMDCVIFRMQKYTNIILKNYIYDKLYINYYQKNFEEICNNLKVTGNILPLKSIDKMQIVFEKELINKYLLESRYDNIILFGNFDIATVIHVLDKFEQIYVFSDSYKYVETLKEIINSKYLKDNRLKKIKVIFFYNGVSNYIISKEKLYNNVDFIIVGNGYGSNIFKIKKFLLRFNILLKTNGKLIFSCINKNQIDNTFVNKNINYYIEKNIMYYSMIDNIRYNIFYKSYTQERISKEIDKVLKVNEIYSFPIMGYNIDLSNEENNRQFEDINIIYALSSQYKNGFYLYVIASKDQTIINFDYPLLDSKYKLIEHALIISKVTQLNQLQRIGEDVVRNNLIKTLVLENDIHTRQMVICLSMNKSLKMEDDYFYYMNDKFRLVTIHTLNKYGVNAGNVSPFILQGIDGVIYIYDTDLKNIMNKYIYFGTNNLTHTYKMRKDEFIRILEKYGYNEYDLNI